jgi:predicted RNA binding protein YcfA (HicA-like mRNA interferase family)
MDIGTQMKRRKLIRFLENNGCEFLREGGNHTVYSRPGAGLQSAIPRHREIKPNLVKKICKDLGIKPPDEK